MPTQILSDNMELTPSMKVLAEQKLAGLMAHIGDKSRQEPSIRVVMNKAQEPDKLLVKIEAKIDGKTYFGDDADFTLELALIRAVDEVNRQYLKDKEKIKDRDYEKNRDMKRVDEADLKLNLLDEETAHDLGTSGNSMPSDDLDLNPPA